MKVSRPRRSVIVVAVILVLLATAAVQKSASGVQDRPGTSWLGEWRGTIIQPDSSVHSWSFAMTLTYARGRIVGSYVEMSLKCRGTLSSTLADSAKLDLDETVTIQPPSASPWFCAGGPIQIRRIGKDSATYSWDGGVAHGVIRR